MIGIGIELTAPDPSRAGMASSRSTTRGSSASRSITGTAHGRVGRARSPGLPKILREPRPWRPPVMRAAIYCRVSSDAQTVDNQLLELRTYAAHAAVDRDRRIP